MVAPSLAPLQDCRAQCRLLLAVLLLMPLYAAGEASSGAQSRNTDGSTVQFDNITEHFLVRLAGHSTWMAVHNSRMDSILALPYNVLIYDCGPCFWAASAAFNIKEGTVIPDPRQSSGGEVVHCRKLLALLHRIDRTVTVVAEFSFLETYVHKALTAGRPPVVIRHWCADMGTKSLNGSNIVQLPFSEACTMQLLYGGNPNPMQASWGSVALNDPEKVISVYEREDGNTHIGFERPRMYPFATMAMPFNRSYVFVFGKLGKPNQCRYESVRPLYKNQTLWELIIADYLVVFVLCPDKIADSLNVEIDTWNEWKRKGNVLCLDDLPSPVPYEQLLVYADAVIGMGCPFISPTPLQALYCQTSVVLPREQHWLVTDTTKSPHAFDPRTSQDVLDALQVIGKCEISYLPELNIRKRKINSCFKQAPKLLQIFDEEEQADKLRGVIEKVEHECHTVRELKEGRDGP